MGTTITAVYVGEQDVAIAHVGDSRAYCMRDSELLRLTDDHSLVDELIRQGKLTPEEAEEHPQRSVITRALGPEASVEVDVRSFRGRPSDVYLLCSDGLTTMVGEAELLAFARIARAFGGRWRGADRGRQRRRRQGQHHGRVAALGGGVQRGRAAERRSHHDYRRRGRATGLLGVAGANLHPNSTSRHGVAVRDDEHAEQPLTPQRPGIAGDPAAPAPAAADPATHKKCTAAQTPSPSAHTRCVAQPSSACWRQRRILALQSVYFIGTNQRGLVTMYNGLPYELPGKIKLYTSDYVSGVSASTLVPARRQALLDHSLRSEGDAAELMRELELGQLSEG